MNGYQALANAIIKLAAEDYRAAAKKLKKNPNYGMALVEMEELEDFFLSGWFATLTSLDGEVLLEKLEKEMQR